MPGIYESPVGDIRISDDLRHPDPFDAVYLTPDGDRVELVFCRRDPQGETVGEAVAHLSLPRDRFERLALAWVDATADWDRRSL